MALKHYTATTGVDSDDYTLPSGEVVQTSRVIADIPTGKELLIFGQRISGGETGGEFNIVTFDVNDDPISTVVFSVAPYDTIYIDTKECLTYGENVWIYGSSTGMTIDVYAQLSDVE